MKINIKRTKDLVFYIFICICILFPQDPYNIKIPLLLIALIIDMLSWLGEKRDQQSIFVSLSIGIAFPALSVALSVVIGEAEIKEIISQAYPSVIMIFLVLNQERLLQYKKTYVILCRALSTVIIMAFVLDYCGIQSVNTGIFQTITSKFGMGGIIKLNNSLFGYKIFLYASPLIIFQIDEDIQENRHIWALCGCLALFLTGTRANLIAMILLLFYALYFQRGEKLITNQNAKKAIRVLLAIIVCACAGKVIAQISSFFSNDYSLDSNNTKLLQIQYILEELKDVKTLFLGKGLGAPVLDPARGIYTTSVEMMVFYYLYEIGLVLFIPFAVFLIYPFCTRVEKHYKIAYLGFLLSAFTNPILTTSTSYMAFLFVYTMIMRKNTVTDMEVLDCV